MLPRDISRLILDEFYIRVELSCYGKALLDSDTMVLESDSCLRIHKAVFKNTLPLIRRIAVSLTENYFYADVNEIDSIGHTPLVLAIKLGREDAIKIICDHYADPKLRPFDSCKELNLTFPYLPKYQLFSSNHWMDIEPGNHIW